MVTCDWLGGILCAAASVPALIAGNVLEGVGMLLDSRCLMECGEAIAGFSDRLEDIGEKALSSGSRITEDNLCLAAAGCAGASAGEEDESPQGGASE